MIARVRGVIASATRAGSRVNVSGSMSASTGRAPTCSITLTDEQNVMGVVMTSSPGPISSANRARCNPAVQELSASAAGAPRYCVNSLSKRLVFGPVVIQAERSVSATAAISFSEMAGGEKGRKVGRLFVFIVERIYRSESSWLIFLSFVATD